MELLRHRLIGRESLVKRHKQHGVMRQPNREEEDRPLLQPHRRPEQSPDEIPDHRQVIRRIRHLREPPLTAGHPLPVDLDLQTENRRH